MIFLAIVNIAWIDLFWQIDIRSWIYANRFFGNLDRLPGLPFSLDLIGISCAYILGGFLAKVKVKSMSFNLPVFSIALLTFASLHYCFNPTTDLAQRIYGSTPVSSLIAISGIYIAISILLDRHILLGKLLSYIGSSSLFILIFHDPIQSLVFDLLSRLSKFEYFNGIGAFITAVIVPVVMLEITKRQRLLSAILLPRKSSQL